MKRDRFQIFYDILSCIRDEGNDVKPTHVLYKSNISYQMLLEYVNSAKNNGLLKEVHDEKGKKRFVLTDRGYNFLSDFEKIREVEESYGLM